MNNNNSCISNYSIDIIPYCVNLFCTQFDLCALFHPKYNCDMHQIYKLDVIVQPSVTIVIA